MSWNQIEKETNIISDVTRTILQLNFPEEGDIQWEIIENKRPPFFTVYFHVISDDNRRPYEVDAHGARVKNIHTVELEKMGTVMGKIVDLDKVDRCHKKWVAPGLLSYKISVEYSKYLPPKK